MLRKLLNSIVFSSGQLSSVGWFKVGPRGGTILWTRRILVAVLVLVFFISLSTSPSCAGANKEMEVGLLIPLTGWASFFGILQDCAFRVYRNEFRDKPLPDGRVIKFIVYDTGGKLRDAILMAQKLIHTDKVHQIIGPFLSTVCEQVFPIVNAAHVPIITASSVKPGLAASNRPWTFRCIRTSEKIMGTAEMSVKWLIRR